MSEDHATPPTAEERSRVLKAAQAARAALIFGAVVILYLMMELGGPWVENAAVVLFVILALGIWWRQRR